MKTSQQNFPNLARRDKDESTVRAVNQAVCTELAKAGIEPVELAMRNEGEVPTDYWGWCCTWTFNRAWRYYIATGSGIPPDKAEEFHKEWGQQCRVDGHCGCPSPLEWFEGFAVGCYHIDTQAGLNAFANLLRSIHRPTGEDE